MEITTLWRSGRKSADSQNSDRLKPGAINIEINHAYGGFFAQLNWCLYIFAYAKAKSLSAHVSLVSLNYRSGMIRRDWFPDFFQYNCPIQNKGHFWLNRKKQIHHILELGFTIPDLTIQQAHDIFFSTVAVRAPICREVDDFVHQKFLKNGMLGIHYRGTDKVAESPQVNYETVERRLDKLLGSGEFLGVFVASDEQKFIDFLFKKVSGVPIVAREDSCRSLDGNPIHIRQPKGLGNKLGLDAIVNCMLLSRCHSVLRTSSFLSAWASIFNPHLHVYLLNCPYAEKLWFPDREIQKQCNLIIDL